ncbi:DoxX-like family protein [Sinosporangium album]|uniref:DoxX-like family protein n=1 Tax=Sinosporangium album TaxID=504805 RepID=A0A1G7XWB9_9ACTN|nr:DoxX family protein [Sinosporangium album]SDG88441.1 DoxX-like family protein [Sinosporangium album]
MFIAFVIVAVITAILFVLAGLPKLLAQPAMVTELGRLGVAPGFMRIVGLLEVLGGLGVLAGIWIGILGILAPAGLILVMLGAIGTHVRAGDTANQTLRPLPLLILAIAALVLRVLAF